MGYGIESMSTRSLCCRYGVDSMQKYKTFTVGNTLTVKSPIQPHFKNLTYPFKHRERDHSCDGQRVFRLYFVQETNKEDFEL